MIVGVHRLAEGSRGECGDHLVCIHVRAGARAGLEHIERELGIVLARGDFCRGTVDGPRSLRIQQLQAGVGTCGGLLHQPEGADERARHLESADREILHGALRLGTPQGLCGYLQLPHAVALDPKGIRHERHSESRGPRTDDRVRYHANPSTSRLPLTHGKPPRQPVVH